MRKLIIFISLLALVGCMDSFNDHDTTESIEFGAEDKPNPYGELIIFYPDGHVDTLDVIEDDYESNSERTWFRDIDGNRHCTTLPMMLHYY